MGLRSRGSSATPPSGERSTRSQATREMSSLGCTATATVTVPPALSLYHPHCHCVCIVLQQDEHAGNILNILAACKALSPPPPPPHTLAILQRPMPLHRC